MKKNLVLTFFFFAVFANGQTILSDSTRISLLTCEPGKEVYARWGHSAIRVTDKKNHIDEAYNYGIFNFSDALTFLAKFIHGSTDYQLAIWNYEDFYSEYFSRKSSVYEQVLDLSQEEKQKLFDALQKNYLPENRIYRYNFVYDNCATRPFDMIFNVLKIAQIITYSHSTTTYRAIFNEFVGLNNWNRFGIDLLIGRDADLPMVDTYALRAFPKYTAQIVGSTILKNDSISKPLVYDTEKISDFPTLLPTETGVFSPNILCCAILVIITLLSYFGWKNKFDFVWLDFLMFFISGIIGTIIFYLMFISVHPLVQQNYNLLWLNPLQLIFAFLLVKQTWRKSLSYYAVFNSFTTLIAMIVFLTRYQVMHPSFLPLMAIYLVRSVLFFQRNFLFRYTH
jgi:hypothetical protein